MANYLSIKLAITDIPLSALKIGSCTLVTFPVPPSPDPPYTFTFYKGMKLFNDCWTWVKLDSLTWQDISGYTWSDLLYQSIPIALLANLKIGIVAGVGHVANNSIKLEISDFLDMSDLKTGVIPRGSANMAEHLYFRRFRVGYQ